MKFEDQLVHDWVFDREKFYLAIEDYDKKHPGGVYSGIVLIHKNFFQIEKYPGVLKVIGSLNVSKESPVMIFLFYLHWFFVINGSTRRNKELEIILRKMEDCIGDNFPNYLKAEYLIANQDFQNDQNSEANFIKAFTLFPTDSVRYRESVKTLNYEFSIDGRLKDEDDIYLNSVPEKLKNIFCCINAVENGQISEALKFKEAALPLQLPQHQAFISAFESSVALLDLYLERKNENETDEHLLSIGSLLARDPRSALNHAKECFDLNPDFFSFLGNFKRFTLIRAQLANKNLDASKLIIESWKANTQRYRFSDFFQARMELLNNNPDKAVKHFAKVLDFCKKNDAMGRLDFELELAIELQPKQVRFLVDNANSVLARNAPILELDFPKITVKIERGLNRIKGASHAINSIKEDIKKFALLDIPILILGETGVGKDVIANAIHEESNRKSELFLAINCSSISESLLQSELFGHEAGAFTGASKTRKGVFEEAGKGTVFLDEIGDISGSMQAALLRVLESGEYRPVGSSKTKMVQCRIITATNALLDSRVDAGTFRLDLLYRLKRLVIHVPPLRERPVDITLLSQYFLCLNKNPNNNIQMSKELEEAFLSYSWPGNVRELKNEMEKMRLLHSGKSAYSLEDAKFLKDSVKNVGVKVVAPIMPAPKEIITTIKPIGISREEVFQNSGSYFRRLETIKALFMEHKKLSRKEICQITGVPDLTIGRDIKALRAENFIKKVEPTKSPRTHYFAMVENKI